MKSFNIVGKGAVRRENDFYPTPQEVTVALCEWMQKNGMQMRSVWEPACGDGRMVKVLGRYFDRVVGTDIQSGMDFLTAEPVGTEWIITNPPFSLAEQFIRKAASCNVPFAFLLKSQYWHSAKRLKLFNEIRPSHVLPLTWRPDFTGKGSSLLDMIWVIWGERAIETTCYQPLQKPLQHPPEVKQ